MNRAIGTIALIIQIATGMDLHLQTDLYSSNSQLQLENQTKMENFLAYLAKFGKNYADQTEFEQRLEYFIQMDDYISWFNSQPNKSSQVGHNAFSDLSDFEKSKAFGSKPNFPNMQESKQTKEKAQQSLDWNPTSLINLQGDFNWADKGAVTGVQDMGLLCNASWAFATAATLEGARQIKDGDLEQLSTQQLISCAGGSYANDGCDGGRVDYAYLYTDDNKLTTESVYPYSTDTSTLGETGTCSYLSGSGVMSADGFSFVPDRSSFQLQASILYGPVGAAIDSSSTAFQMYSSGVLTQDDCLRSGETEISLDELNYYVTVVGYNMKNDPPYYIVKNSMGTSWGNEGYVYMEVVDGHGTCGIQLRPMYPNVLLTDTLLVYIFKLGIMLFALVGVTPYCIYILYKRKKEIHFLHPGQESLQKVIWFQAIALSISTVFFLISEGTKGSFMMQQLSVMAFYMVLNLSFLLLSKALGAAETNQGEDRHKGVTILPFVIFAVIFATIWLTTLLLVCLNGASVSFWDNMNMYFNVHLASDYKGLFGLMFLAGVCVMSTIMYNFHQEQIRQDHGKLANVAIGLCAILAIINALHIIFLCIFPLGLVMGFISFGYFLIAVCGLLPFLSHLILRLEAEGQAKRGEGDTWALNNHEDDVLSVASGTSYQ